MSRDANRLWSLVHAERRALVDDLAGLDPSSWDVASLCGGWSVHDVAAHLVDNARTTRLGIVVRMARAHFDFDRQNQQGVERFRGATPSETLERLRAVIGLTATPPAPLASRLVEEVVHGEDVRRPLGLRHDYAPEAVEHAIAHQAATSTRWGGSREHLDHVRIEADDLGLVLGSGPLVTGPAVALLLALCGRPAALAALRGPGAAVLAGRLGV